MELLHEFKLRVAQFQEDSVPREGDFGLHPGVNDKVAAQTGELLPFFGSTAAFFLDEKTINLVQLLTDAIYSEHGGALSARLPLLHAHMTLHDLHASSALDHVASTVFLQHSETVQRLSQARSVGPIRMTCVSVFNLLNTSIAIGLAPKSDLDHDRLTRARGKFAALVPSGPFTPHITLAYYRPEPAFPIRPDVLRSQLRSLTATVRDVEVDLQPEQLFILHFSSMADYWMVT